MSVSDIRAYHKLITDSYDKRSENYNDSQPHREQAQQLVDYYPPPIAGRVLDVGTGTGAAAFHAAGYVGDTGEVLGVDISTGMINKASELLRGSGLAHVRFVRADGERLQHTKGYFDRIYCASAFFWMTDKQQALTHWYGLLKPGGVVGFHAWPETSYVFGFVARQALKNYGVEYLAHSPYGSVDIVTNLLVQAGYHEVDVKVIESGHYLGLQQAIDAWIDESDYPIGQFPHPVTVAPPGILEQARQDYIREMQRLNTDKGVWNDTTQYYAYARKPHN